MSDDSRGQAPRVSVDDESYASLLAREAELWATTPLDFERAEALVPPALQLAVNEQLTGRADVHWLDDLTSRGPFRAAAVLGATSGYLESRWLERHASETLDVYELSPGVIQKARRRLSVAGLPSGVRFIRADLNVAKLPPNQYDVVWSASALHHLVELEHMCEQVRRALKPNGLFAFYEYIGEKRIQFNSRRLRLCEEALASVPGRYWRDQQHVRSPDPGEISPFEALRSDEIFGVVSAAFDTVHWAEGGVLAAVAVWLVDFLLVASEAPEILDRFIEAEKRSTGSDLGGCLGYGVFRRRA